MSRFAKSGLLALCALLCTSAVIAQEGGGPPTPEQQADQAAKTRQGLLKVIGFYMAPLGGMLKNKVPFDAAKASTSATHIAQLGSMIPDVFVFDTRKVTSIKTQAKDSVWTNTADFDSKADDLVKAANALLTAAKGGDQAATLTAANAVGKACKACHDDYRSK